MKPNLTFFFDLDGVLYDFEAVFNVHLPDRDVEDDSTWTWQELHARCPDVYRIGEAMPGMREVFAAAANLGEVRILTAIPKRWSWPNCTTQKRDWCMEHLGVHPASVLFGPYAEDKQWHCRSPFDVLIDDRPRNCQQWLARRGRAIEHVAASETMSRIHAIHKIWKEF